MRKRDVAMILAAVAVALGVGLGVYFYSAIPTAGWGLSFREPGLPPVGNAGADQLARFDACYRQVTEEKVLYLTFDAGYENGYTASILDTLRETGVPAAFFLVGHYLDTHPDLVRRMAEEGHTVGNHTLTHPDMSKLEEKDAFSRELLGMEEKYRSVTGRELEKYYRPPQGLYSQQNLEFAQELGYKTVFWSLAYADWDNNNQPQPTQALEKLMSRVHPGAVVLLHATSKTNGQILGQFIRRCQEEGYRFAPIGELFG